jgi:hypothetical protein
MWLTCPTCSHGWESSAKTRSQCGLCGKAVSVPRSYVEAGWSGYEGEHEGSRMPLGVIAVVLIAAGLWMLHHAKTTDPSQESDSYRAWHWVLGGLGCLGSGGLLGAYALGMIGSEVEAMPGVKANRRVCNQDHPERVRQQHQHGHAGSAARRDSEVRVTSSLSAIYHRRTIP